MSTLFKRSICTVLVTALLTPATAVAGEKKQGATSTQQPQVPAGPPLPDAGATSTTVESQPVQSSRDQLPDSPDAIQSKSTAQLNTNDQAQPAPVVQPNPPQPPPSKAQQPAGTAAAQVEGTTGDAAYKPAGAAIAPAKQKRRRMLLIKVGALLGAGVAIGSVAALSSASPSRPPGSH